MFDSPRSLQHGQTVECDICVAGAGAAGITLALELDGSRSSVCVLEAGDFDRPRFDDASHPYAGESVGEPYNLRTTRLRYFGGSTNHWAGWCMPLDPIDFRPRSFVPLSGWPFERSELDPYYPRAATICEIDPPGFELTGLPGSGDLQRELLDHWDPDFTSKLLRFSPPTRFGPRYRSAIEQSRQVRCLLDSTVVEIEETAGTVSRLHVRSGDKHFFVKARLYVMALGGIENARLLLCSDRTRRDGVGNESGFVGRCFADHFGRSLGRALMPSGSPYLRRTRFRGVDVMLHVSFRDELLEQYRLHNFGVVMGRLWTSELTFGAGYFDDARLYPEWRTWTPRLFNCFLRAEPTPNPDSRVTLLDERDANGMRRVRLDWRIRRADLDAVERTAELFGRKLGMSGVGRFRQTYSSRSDSGRFVNLSHHMGTTRMSADPRAGVTDWNCRVHGVDNLYVAGSSVFPTFGFMNPTLTIVALAVRLAAHLRQRMAG